MENGRIEIRRSKLIFILVGACLLSAAIGISLFALMSDALRTSAIPSEETNVFLRWFRSLSPSASGTSAVAPALKDDLSPTSSLSTTPSSTPSSSPIVPGSTFRGPSGPPHIIGPKSNPPNY
ncbi:MAG TPA: hypothetical protein VMC43_03280 [Candidatus Paceibacterota bacterium]|nr:hypothetical protein [Candidatus Paceibacterota bacterium]